MNATTPYDHVKNRFKPSSKANKNTKVVQELLKIIRIIRRVNNCTIEQLIKNSSGIKFDDDSIDDSIAILNNFSNTRPIAKKLKNARDAELFLTRMISSLERLKHLSDRGDLYYSIIANMVRDTDRIKNTSLIRKYEISRATFYLKQNEALNLTYEIWFGAGLLKEALCGPMFIKMQRKSFKMKDVTNE